MAQGKWENTDWSELGRGEYNEVYQSKDKQHVLKIQRADLSKNEQRPDLPERSVRIWNEINPDLPAEIAQTKRGKGWICPFIAGEHPSDQEISDCVIEIFNKTGRILSDAPGQRNFVKTPEGRVVCIDIGLALEMEQRQLVVFSGGHKRKKSVDSLEIWKNLTAGFFTFFQDALYSKPITTNTVRALLFIKANRPDIFDASFLKQSTALTEQLAKGYQIQYLISALKKQGHDMHYIQYILSIRKLDANDIRTLADLDRSTPLQVAVPLVTIEEVAEEEPLRPIQGPDVVLDVPIPTTTRDHERPESDREVTSSLPPKERDGVTEGPVVTLDDVDKGLQMLKKVRPIDLKNIKESCIEELKRYISLRGTIDDKGHFNPSLITQFFRNKELTASKVGIARELIANIDKAQSIDEMIVATNKAVANPDTSKSRFTPGLATSIEMCALMMAEFEVQQLKEEHRDSPSLG